MKGIFLRYALSVGVLMLVTAGCDHPPEAPTSTAAQRWSQLERNDFLLSRYNGIALPSNKPPALSFRRGHRVTGNICNRFTGLGHVP